METVTDVCRKTGVTRKRLFYYDRIGILKPTKRIGPQKTKMYSPKAVERLNQILLYQKAGLRLSEIRLILDGDEEQKKNCLNKALQRLQEEVSILREQIAFASEMLADLDES